MHFTYSFILPKCMIPLIEGEKILQDYAVIKIFPGFLCMSLECSVLKTFSYFSPFIPTLHAYKKVTSFNKYFRVNMDLDPWDKNPNFILNPFIETHSNEEQYLLMETRFLFQLIFIIMLAWSTSYKKWAYTHKPNNQPPSPNLNKKKIYPQNKKSSLHKWASFTSEVAQPSKWIFTCINWGTWDHPICL